MKIAALQCSSGLNLGNDFINSGGRYLIKQLFKDSEIEYFEFFDSCLPHWNSGHLLTESSIDYISNKADLVVLFSGSAASPTLYKSVFKKLNTLDVPFILLGIGCGGRYDDSEKKVINDINNLSNCKNIITRDHLTYSFIDDQTKCYSGLDLGFFAGDNYNVRNENSSKEYAVINYEPDGECDIDRSMELKKQAEKFYDHVYIVENSVQIKSRDIEDYLQIGCAEQLWNLYSNASHVITSRVHSCVCCVSNGVDFTYVGPHDYGGKTGRNTLFNQIGMTLNYEEEYIGKDQQKLLKLKKKNYINQLRDFLL